MKASKKVVLSTAAVLGVAALVAGGTIAYFTDTEKTDNNFTVGNVDIKLYESQLHRMNSGRTGEFAASASDPDYCDWINVRAVAGSTIDNNTGAGPQNGNYESAKYCTPGMDASEGDASTISAIENQRTGRTWGYKDETIISDAETYKTGYFARESQNIVPGQFIRKFAYVLNNDTNNKGNDAYVLIRYMVPKTYASVVDFELPSSAYLEDKNVQTTTHGNGYFTLVKKNGNAYEKVAIADKNALKAYRGYEETIDNTEYIVYAAVTTEALKPGEMTFWSPINTFKLNENEKQTDSSDDAFGDVSYANAAISVKVDAQAIQAKTFNDAIDAINHL